MASKKVTKKVTKKKPSTSQPSSRKKSGRSASSANKAGKQFERDVAMQIRHIFPLAERELEFQASGNRGNDIQGCAPFLFQCKSYANYVPLSKLKEVRPAKGEIAVLVTKGINMPPLVALSLKDFTRILESAFGIEEQMVAPQPAPEEEPSWVEEPDLTDEEHEHISELDDHFQEQLNRERDGEAPALDLSAFI